MKITSKGQVTIPLEFRNKLGFLPGTEVQFVADRGGLRLIKPKAASGKGRKLVEHMRGRGDSKLTTDEIIAQTREKLIAT